LYWLHVSSRSCVEPAQPSGHVNSARPVAHLRSLPEDLITNVTCVSQKAERSVDLMRSVLRLRSLAGVTLALALAVPARSASKPHVVFLGKPQPVKMFVGRDENQSVTISVRSLYVDTKLKDYTTGDAHDVTDRQFVVQRAYRLNDSLPGDSPKQSKWVWQRGDWLLVDRVSGHIAAVKLPDFDAAASRVSWYRDYAAYCGVSDNGTHWSALVAQVEVRKALFRKELNKTAAADTDAPAVDCSAAKWERSPARVTFSPAGAQPFTVNVVSRHAEELVSDSEVEQ
jgi:hypothetical protein